MINISLRNKHGSRSTFTYRQENKTNILKKKCKIIWEKRSRDERNGEETRWSSIVVKWVGMTVTVKRKQQLQTRSSHFDWSSVGVLRLNSQQRNILPYTADWWFRHQNQKIKYALLTAAVERLYGYYYHKKTGHIMWWESDRLGKAVCGILSENLFLKVAFKLNASRGAVWNCDSI